jgi:hypothetical protein
MLLPPSEVGIFLIILLSNTFSPCYFLDVRGRPIQSNRQNRSLEYFNLRVPREESNLILKLNLLLSDWETVFINIMNMLRYVEF